VNTKFCYLYRDACNYKSFFEVILFGVIHKDQIESFLKDRLYFIPSEVGFPDLQGEEFTIDDHIWHEFEYIELTEDSPTSDVAASLLIEKFRRASQNNWNEYEVLKRKGFI